jgi:hypothetical protein
MAGKPLANFADFVKATNERILTPPKEILSDAIQRTYTIADALKGRTEDEVVQSGKTITDRVQLTAGTGFSFYDPNEQFSPQIEDTLSTLTAPWRFAKDYWAWTDHEIVLNGSGGDRFTQFKSLRDSKRQASHVSLFNGLDAAIWATPNNSLMESTTTTNGRPYSIRCFITEDGLAPSGFTNVTRTTPASESALAEPVQQLHRTRTSTAP